MSIEIKDGYLVFSCGCKFKIINKNPLKLELNPESDSKDMLSINSNIDVGDGKFVHINEIPLDCSRTWDMISSGNTKGVFQLETRLGQASSKKLMPRNIEHLAALGAVLRPGCLSSKRDSKTITDHYIDRKNGAEEVDYFHDCLEPILSSTYGEMIYQEQAMQIAQLVAGFDLQQADVLRKAIGKKKADIMAKVKEEFLEGCKTVGILTNEQAEEIFSWIEKSQRYSFNKSHSVAYAMNGYLSAFIKAHFKQTFFASWLFFAKDKQKPFDEIKLLINNAKVMGVDVYPPDFRNDNNYFQRIKNVVYFGFCNIKGVGESSMVKIKHAIFNAETAMSKKRDLWTWEEFLIHFSQFVTSTATMGMIESGALDYFKIDRSRMAYEYTVYSELTKKEQIWFQQNVKEFKGLSLRDMLSKGVSISSIYTESTAKERKLLEKGPCANKNRVAKALDLVKVLDNPPHSLKDTAQWIARIEEAKLGIPLTACLIDDCKNVAYANCTCEDFLNRNDRTSGLFIAAQIDDIKTHITKGGRDPGSEMAFVEFSDSSSSISGVIFADAWEDIKMSGVCVKENAVMISGERGRERDSFIVKKMTQLS